MEDHPSYVKHRRSGIGARLAALAGLAGGLAVLVGIAWAATAWQSAPPPPPPPPPPPAAPEQPTLRIVFPEGFTREEMAERIREVNRIARTERNISPLLSPRRYRELTARRQGPRGFGRVAHLEGFLFPATYDFTAETTTRELVRMQLDAFRQVWADLDLEYARSRNLSSYDVLIIASMIEKEVQVPKERALVSAVIYNRLATGLPLGIDATLRYGLGIPPTESIRQSQLEDPTPYNTRIHAGLPPTPIGNPGLAALQAAAHPADVDYLYFVRNEDCKTHFFTASEEEFYERLAQARC